jgi:lipoyl(octanoyl) transferase
MDSQRFSSVATAAASPLLQVYLLGRAPFETVQALQRQLVFRVESDRQQAALILCEHPPVVTVGRLGSRAHIAFEPEELRLRGWSVRWINRGGGCLLHVPGQLAIYPIVALDRLGCNVQEYLDRLSNVVMELLRDFTIDSFFDPKSGNVLVERRSIAGLGVAVRRWVAYHGAFLNVHPDLDLVRRVRSAPGAPPMTSMERERHGPVAMTRVRERAIELIAEQLGFDDKAVFFEYPGLIGAIPLDSADMRFAAQPGN